jgi:hypothetical protein
LVLHFSDFSTIFYSIYKKQAIHFTIGVTLLQGGPRKDLWFRNVARGRRRCSQSGKGGVRVLDSWGLDLGDGLALGDGRASPGASQGVAREESGRDTRTTRRLASL